MQIYVSKLHTCHGLCAEALTAQLASYSVIIYIGVRRYSEVKRIHRPVYNLDIVIPSRIPA